MSRRFHRSIVSALVIVALAVPSIAAASETDDAEQAEPTPISAESGAAVEASPPEAPDDAQPWTVRYVFPLIITLTVVALGGVATAYFFRVKGRYEVVQNP